MITFSLLWADSRSVLTLCVTLEEKSGGRVLDPVSLLIRKVFQLVNLCRMADGNRQISQSQHTVSP